MKTINLAESSIVVGLVAMVLCVPLPAAPAQSHHPPAKPSIAPLIAQRYPNDANGDRIDDRLAEQVRQSLAAEQAATTPPDTSRAQTPLHKLMDVELIFKEPNTQMQIDAFVALGGEITYLYKAVSYGWNGRIPLSKVRALPEAMGSALVLIQGSSPIAPAMYEASRVGRVRPIWAPGFAGYDLGFQGSTNITIGFLDMGIDGTHPDLAGRGVYAANFTGDSATGDVLHGTHAAGIALGSGLASGIGTSSLLATEIGSLAGASLSNSSAKFPIELPTNSVTVTMTARWIGGGNSSLYLSSRLKGVSGPYNTFGGGTYGGSPLTLTKTITGDPARQYSPVLVANGSNQDFVITTQVSGYPGLGDGFTKLRGVAPGCNWADARVGNSSNTGLVSWANAALDDLAANRIEKKIKVINISTYVTGDPGRNLGYRQKVDSAVNNGIVVVTAAGNDGTKTTAAQREIDDPGRAALGLTVGAANDINQLTDYTGHGFDPTDAAGQDFKPDLIAPGGSDYYTYMLAADNNASDETFLDLQPNDYSLFRATSRAAAFTSGCAALVIDAMERQGIQWDFNSSRHSLYVKMLLCATASESHLPREAGGFDPTLERDSPGPNGYPAGKDPYEGYGMINPDAAVEAVSLTLTNGITNNATFGGTSTDRRVWARTVNLSGGHLFTATLGVPLTGDFDLYLYSAQSSSNGTPVLLASSAQCCGGVSEALSYAAPTNGSALLTIKRISGSGTVSLVTDELPPPVIIVGPADPANFRFSFASIPGRTYVVQYKDLLDDSDWQILQSVPGDGTTKVITDPLSSAQRFYRIAME